MTGASVVVFVQLLVARFSHFKGPRDIQYLNLCT